mgnify:CR=1 FL=1
MKAQQGNEEHCASHTLHEKLLETDPTYAKQHIRNENEIQDLVQAMQASAGNGSQAQVFGDTLEIPVVVHVIHTGQNVGVGANISTAQINGAIEAINDRYRKTPNTHGDAAGVDTEIQFILAKRDPDCNATTGIVRVNGSSVTDYSNEGITAEYESGLGRSTLDVIQSNSILLNSRIALANSERNYLLAQFNVLKSVGQLNSTHLKIK